MGRINAVNGCNGSKCDSFEREKQIEMIKEQNLHWSPSLLKNERLNQIFFYMSCGFAVPQQSV